jgi:hypothetical protein
MKTFLTKVTLFLVVQAAVFALFWNPNMPHEHNFLAATIDKHQRLASTRSPRVILIGGSNLAFGIKSDVLEEGLRRPVVNMGLNSQLHIRFMLDEVEASVGPGDVVVLSPEYHILSEAELGLLGVQIAGLRPHSGFFIPPKQWKDVIDRYGFSLLGDVVRRTLVQRFESDFPSGDGSYRRELFDAQGSYIGHYSKDSIVSQLAPTEIRKMPQSIRTRLEQFTRSCRERGARCFYSCPPYPKSLLPKSSERISENLAQLREVPNLIVLDNPEDHAYYSSAFYDSSYHLTEHGAGERTQRLIDRLRPFLIEHEFAALPGKKAP